MNASNGSLHIFGCACFLQVTAISGQLLGDSPDLVLVTLWAATLFLMLAYWTERSERLSR